MRKTVRHISSSTSTHSLKKTSRTPSEERIDDSDYLTQSNGNLATSKTSSQSSLAGRFPSEESLGRSPSAERSRDEWDSSNSSSSKNSSSEWYTEYRTQSFQSGSSKLEYVRTKSQYEEHIDNIRGMICMLSSCIVQPWKLMRLKSEFSLTIEIFQLLLLSPRLSSQGKRINLQLYG